MEKKLKILHISTEGSWRGGEQQISYLMDELETKNVENILVVKKKSEMHLRYPKSIPLSFSGEWDFLSVLKLKSIIKQKKIDVIHAHTGHGHTYAILCAGNTPVVVSKRTDYPIRNNFFSHWKFNHSSIKKFLCVSNKIQKILQKDLAHPEKAMTIYSGIDVQKFPNHPKVNIRSLAGIPQDAKVVISTAALAPQKDYDTFLKVAEQTPHIHYVICGSGPSEIEIKEKAQSLNNTHFLGFRKDLVDFIGSADAFLITSKEEGLGTSILDAFAVGLPVVATAAGGIPEIVRHNETGLLANIADAQTLAAHVLKALDQTNSEIQFMIENAKKLAHEFSYKRTAQKSYEVYLELLNIKVK
jgi:L-malate glycosyltransferase